MSFGKSFLISLVALVVLNVAILAITYAIGYGFDVFIAGITANAIHILYVLFSSTGHPIWWLIEGLIYSIGSEPFNWAYFIYKIGFIIAPLIAAVITGRLSEKQVHAFAGFFLSTIISMLVCIILIYQGFAYQIMLAGKFNQAEAIINVILGSLVNGLIYGMIAYLTTKK